MMSMALYRGFHLQQLRVNKAQRAMVDWVLENPLQVRGRPHENHGHVLSS